MNHLVWGSCSVDYFEELGTYEDVFNNDLCGTISMMGHLEVLLLKVLFYFFKVSSQVLAEEGKAKALAFGEIDKAPAERQRRITILRVIVMHICFVEA
ncbi:hypothetical protein IFM89_015995 [Coptis chinensis]|uniref:Uncharacterized protein n=1 Tax=Coptis chinensis TaxID=261450 RepID=A0A835HMG5_9MAGN|nr:hypothetical protein IFM89_015995 [Coptis chinensis]